MKKTTFLFFTILMSVLSWQAMAQTGSTCDAPIVVSAMPFNDAGNTATYGNDYTGTDVPPVAPGAVTTGTGSMYYLGGDDVVYSYSPGSDGFISINTTNNDDWVGLWVFTGCPFSSTVGYHTSTSGATRSIVDLPVTMGEIYYIVISGWDIPTSYTITITGTDVIELDPCTEAVAGTIVGETTRQVCANSPFSMSVEGNSGPAQGLIRTWQSSPAGAGTWADLGVSSPILNVAGIETATDYRYHVECDNGDSDNSNMVSVTINPNPSECYCIPQGTNQGRYINNFSTTGGVQNISNLESGFSPNGYGDFTAMVVEANPGDELSFTTNYVGGTFGLRIWVDWNQDGAFDTTEEVAFQSSSYGATHSGSFTVPVDVMGGTTRMRIANHYLSATGNIDPCATAFGNGEFEDYSFIVIPLEGCTGAVAGSIVGDLEREVCTLAPFTITVEGISDPAEGLVRTWQSSPAGMDTWTDLGESSATLNIAGIDSPTDFRYHVECVNGDIDNSEVVSVSLNPNPSECYCTPEGTDSSRYIDNFSTTGGIQNISNLASGFSPGGYGDYTAMTVEGDPGDELSFSTSIMGGTAGFRIWVDWNHDGAFDPTEEVVYNSTGYSTEHTGSFSIPMDAASGETRMRVVSHWLSTTGDIDPCATGFSYGEFEDYTLNVTGGSGPFPSPYCDIVDAEDVIVEEISKVDFAGTSIVNENTSDVLVDKTDVVVTITAGETYTLSVEGNTYGDFDTNIVAFIDWNQNAILDDAGEIYELGTISNSTGDDGISVTQDILVPADAILGQTRIRITKTYFDDISNPVVTPCGIQFDPFGWGIEAGYGQALDFTLNIEAGSMDDCSGTPEGGIATVTPESGYVNTPYTVSATGFTSGNGLTYQWQSNTDGAGWTNEGTAENTYAPFMATAPSESGTVVEWRLEVTCTFSTETAYSSTATFTTTEPSIYCIPVLDCSDGDSITNVTFQEIDNTTECSSSGYGDFTAMAATVQSGGIYPISVSVGDGWDVESASVWIDFDNSGSFDEGEFFYIGTGSGEALPGNIEIPAGLADGNYTMRVRVAAVPGQDATWDMACDEEQGYGETEDYTVTVDGSVGMDSYSNLNFSYHPNPMSDILYLKANQTIMSVSAYNVLGQQVLDNKEYADGKVDVSSLPTGAFIFHVTFEGGLTENFKVLKR